MEWTAIVMTCPNSNYTSAYQIELDKKIYQGFLSKETTILVVEDPKSQIGSGGATLNALLVLAEHISAKRGYSVVNSDVLEGSRILLIHSGRILPHEPCGRPFVILPLSQRAENRRQPQTVCLIDIIIDVMSWKVAPNSPAGVWVCSSDMLLSINETIDEERFIGADAFLLVVPSTVDYAKDHGVCEIDDKSHYLKNIHFKCKNDNIINKNRLSSGLVPLVSGIVYLSLGVVNTLLMLYTISPLDACTYLGCDSGIAPIQLSLFFDLLLAMCPGYPEERFVEGGIYGGNTDFSRGHGSSNEGQGEPDFTSFARRVVYKHFSAFKCKALLVNGSHTYLTWPGHQYLGQILSPSSYFSPPSSSSLPSSSSSSSLPSSSSSSSPTSSSSSSSSYEDNTWRVQLKKHFYSKGFVDIDEGVGLLNCSLRGRIKIGSGSLLQNLSLKGVDIEIGKGCIVNGVVTKDASKFHLRDDSSLIGFTIGRNEVSRRCVVVFGCHDNVRVISTFCNIPFEEFKVRTGISDDDLWFDSEPRSVYNAKLFPISPRDGYPTEGGDSCRGDDSFVEFIELLQAHTVNDEVLHRWKISDRISLEGIFNDLDVEEQMEFKRSIFHEVSCEIIEDALVHNQPLEIQELYKVACCDGRSLRLLEELDRIGCANHQCLEVSARVLANMANLLGEMSMGRGGLRSGPASNLCWMGAFKFLEKGDVIGGLKMMSQERRNWLNSSSRMVRAARHYEGACQVLIRQAVMSVHKFIKTKPCKMLAIDQWVTCHCPARIDISGGWSDTPPLTYESGGAVFNAAVTVNGLRPIGAQARRIANLELVIHLESGLELVGNELEFMANHNQPSAAGSLIKACLLCSGLVEYPSQVSLVDQLKCKFNSGFEIKSWSNLPHGSGLGTSSIMAGAVLACLWRSSGHSFGIHSLNHAVLYVEQLLTTGGGWQDQVGGLCRGVKLGSSRPCLPMEVEVNHVNVPEDVMRDFNNRLVLVYTGKTRLAKNLLQNVIRNWYTRDDEVMKIIKDLVKLAHASQEAFQNGDLMQLGQCMAHYWKLKKTLAPSSESRAVTQMMEALEDRCHGICMAGAGGGGFMYLLTKQEHDEDNVRTVLRELKSENHPIVYEARVDEEGMMLKIEGQSSEMIPFNI